MGRHSSILLVLPEEPLQNSFFRLLSKNGYEVAATRPGSGQYRATLKALKTRRFDLLILGSQFFEAAEYYQLIPLLTKSHPQPRIIVISNRPREELPLLAKSDSLVFLCTPFPPMELLEVLDAINRGEQVNRQPEIRERLFS